MYCVNTIFDLPQQPLVVMTTARTGYGCSRSTDHHGDGSLSVSVHLLPSCTVVGSPSFALAELPPLAVVDWLVGLCTATLVPESKKCYKIKILLNILYTYPICCQNMYKINVVNSSNVSDYTKYKQDRHKILAPLQTIINKGYRIGWCMYFS